MIYGWITQSFAGEINDLDLPVSHEALYKDRESIGLPSEVLTVERGLPSVSLRGFHRTFELTLSKTRMYDILLVDRIE